MILKPLRISRHLSQEQLAEMSGLNVRTIQRIESGSRASVESLKCIAAALDVDVETLNQETFKMDKQTDNWTSLSPVMKAWFRLNFLQKRPTRKTATRIINLSHVFGFLFCCLGLVNEAALVGGLILLAGAYFTEILRWQGDQYGIWFDV